MLDLANETTISVTGSLIVLCSDWVLIGFLMVLPRHAKTHDVGIVAAASFDASSELQEKSGTAHCCQQES